MLIEEEVRAFMKIIGLDALNEQMETKKDIDWIYRKIDQVLELIKETVRRLEKKKEETGVVKVKSKKKSRDVNSIGKEDRNTGPKQPGDEGDS